MVGRERGGDADDGGAGGFAGANPEGAFSMTKLSLGATCNFRMARK
jgi:hypothetical protein